MTDAQRKLRDALMDAGYKGPFCVVDVFDIDDPNTPILFEVHDDLDESFVSFDDCGVAQAFAELCNEVTL
jgi:hypothetical protein